MISSAIILLDLEHYRDMGHPGWWWIEKQKQKQIPCGNDRKKSKGKSKSKGKCRSFAALRMTASLGRFASPTLYDKSRVQEGAHST